MQYEELCREVEQQLQCKLKTRGDFDYLSEQIEKKIGETLSSNTLMRLWGYRQSVNARRSSLDILARFCGYEDYTRFKAAKGILEEELDSTEEEKPVQEEKPKVPTQAEQADSPKQEKEEEEKKEKEQPAPKRRWRWLVAALAAFAIAAGAAVYCLSDRSDMSDKSDKSKEAVFLTEVSELRNDRKYLIHTRNKSRGSLGIASPELATTCPRAIFHCCKTASAFAILKFEGSYFLYSTVSNRFISINSFESDDPFLHNCCLIDIIKEQGYFVFNFWYDRRLGRVATLNVNWKDGIVITPWGTYNGIFDNGNLFSIEDAGPFDATEALEKLRVSADKHRNDIYHPDSLRWRQILFL